MAFKHGIVLAHGFLGFGDIDGLNYFRGVKAHLDAQGYRVLQPTVNPIASVQERSASLSAQIKAWAGADKVHVIAHSMGGLDVRYLLQPKGGVAGELFASVTTLCTPHLGTPLATIVAGQADPIRLLENPEFIQAFVEAPVLEAAIVAQFALHRLTHPFRDFAKLNLAFDELRDILEHLRGRNIEPFAQYISQLFTTNDAGVIDLEPGAHLSLFSNEPVHVPCFCYSAAATPFETLSPELLLPNLMLRALGAGDNDGLVPDSSATAWGTFVECFPADHIGVVGWGNDNQLAWFDRMVANIAAHVPQP